MHKVIQQQRKAAFTRGIVITSADREREQARDAAVMAAIIGTLDSGVTTDTPAGAPDDGQPHVRPTMLPVIPAAAGRNEKCPCGSGKKYKKCHLGKPLAVTGT